MDHTRFIACSRINVKLLVELCGIFLVAMIVSGCSEDPSNSFSITVEHLPIEQNEPESENSIDYSSAVVSIKRVDFSETNDEVLSELISSQFRNGRVKLRGNIEHPMWVEVLVESDTSNKTLRTRTFVEPGESISLAVVETENYIDDTIAHVGTLSNVQDPSKKFSLVGDFNSLNVDFRHAIAFLETSIWNEKGDRVWEIFSYIVIQDGKFVVEIEVEEPVIFYVVIYSSPAYSSYARFIAEPGATIFLQPSRHSVHSSANLTTGWLHARQDVSQRSQNQSSLDITGSARHSRLIDSWQKSFTYRLISEQYDDVREEYNTLRAELEEMRPILDETNELQSSEGMSSLTMASGVSTDPAEGCEHINLLQVRSNNQDLSRIPLDSRGDELRDEMFSIQNSTLLDIARRARDPFDSLLALELAGFQSTQQHLEAIKIYDELSQVVSQNIVDKRIAPAREYISSFEESKKNEHRTVPGQLAPDFELPNLHGTSQNFSKILEENDVVFLTFLPWGQIDSVPNRLASLRDTYGEAGFQIVEVLFDVDSDQQQELASNQDITWIQLLDPTIYSRSEIAKSYAIVHRNMNYLVDAHGCIVQRNLDLVELSNYLNSYFDIPANTE